MNRSLAPFLVVCGIALLCGWAVSGHKRDHAPAADFRATEDLAPAVKLVDDHLAQEWRDNKLTPAEMAPDLQVLRRLMLSLMGTVPSVEEVRQFEADNQPDRVGRWTQMLLNDRRYADYIAQRLSRCFVGADDGQFIVFRRDRFNAWLSEQLHNSTPYDEIVRKMVASKGLWTGQPESNFITAAQANDDLDENKLATRSVRAFLGQSMDCAQCHDHFFAEWKQHQFAGIASHFGKTKVALGVFEDKEKVFKVQNRKTLEDEVVEPAVPFHSDWVPQEGKEPRQQLAEWFTHPENRRFERAIANRMWGLMFGKPFIAPVDDMPNPPEKPDVLDLIGRDFRQHNCDLRRMVQVIVSTRAFRQASDHSATDPEEVDRLTNQWAVFPLTRLRPEQVIGSMLQASYIQKIDQNSHLFVRGNRFFRERDFVQAYGDLGDQELVDRAGTIPQALLRMNGEMTRDTIKIDPLSSANRISNQCDTNKDVVELCYLACLARRPTAEEEAHFLDELGDRKGDAREVIVEDIFWTLFNSPEFSWNH